MSNRKLGSRKQLGIAGRSEYRAPSKTNAKSKRGATPPQKSSDSTAASGVDRQHKIETVRRERDQLDAKIKRYRRAMGDLRAERRRHQRREPGIEERMLKQNIERMQLRKVNLDRWLATHANNSSDGQQAGKAGKKKRGLRKVTNARNVRRARLLDGTPTSQARRRATLIG